MESRIKTLLEKYWEGDTSLQEEKELKEYFAGQSSQSPLSDYFTRQLQEGQRASKRSYRHPARIQRQTWLSIAASIALGVTVALWVLNDAKNQREYVIEDPQEAYEMTRKALLMISENLNEGAAYSTSIKKINEAKSLVTAEKKENQ